MSAEKLQAAIGGIRSQYTCIGELIGALKGVNDVLPMPSIAELVKSTEEFQGLILKLLAEIERPEAPAQ